MTDRMHTFLLVSGGPGPAATLVRLALRGRLHPSSPGSRQDGQASRPKATLRDAIIGGSGWTSLLELFAKAAANQD